MSTATTKKLLTAEEFAEWVQRPENQPRHFELVRGEVVEMSRPGERHGLVCLNIGTTLNLYARQRRKGYALSNDPGVLLERDPDTVRGPDVAYFEKGKKYGELNPKFREDLPTLAVEVLSPTDRIGKVTRRVAEFHKAGIPLVWVVDPEGRDVTVYRAGRAAYAVEQGQELTGDDVLPDFRSPVADFFLINEEPTEAPG
jgi:Uma2 family endonuclease